MAMIPENPVVGGTVLRRAAIQSPNFVTGSAGWQINQNGSAEFNNIVIRNGQIVSGTALFYSGPAAAGNLIASIAAAAGTDSKGNAYLAGVTSYDPVLFAAVNLHNGATSFYAAASEAGPWTLLGQLADGIWQEPAASGLNLKVGAVPAQVQITSALVDLTVNLEVDANTLLSGSGAGGLVLNVQDSATLSAGAALIRAAVASAVSQIWLGCLVTGDTNNRLILEVNASGNPQIRLGPGNAAPDITVFRGGANLLSITGADLDIATLGRGLRVAEGVNGRSGTVTLVAGSATVANTSVTASTRIYLSRQAAGGTLGHLSVTRVAGTSFTITASGGADTSVIAWLLIEPG